MPNLLDGLFFHKIWRNGIRKVATAQDIEFKDDNGNISVETVNGRTVVDVTGLGGSGSGSGDIEVDYVISPTVTNHAHSGLTAVDGAALLNGQVIVDTSHATAADRGFFVANVGPWTRPGNYDDDAGVASALKLDIRVKSGTARAGTRWTQTDGTTILGSKTFKQLVDTIDKPHHDKIWASVVYIAPSGDATGATDGAAINAALAAGRSVQLSPGQYYTSVSLSFQTQYGVYLRGRGPRQTALNYTGAMIAGFDLFMLDGAVNCEVRGIEVNLGLAFRAARENIAPNQPHGNRFKDLHLYGPNTITATSATSLTVTAASKTVTGLSTAAFPVNTYVWLGSRGCGSWMSGIVTSTSGDLVFTADHAFEDPTAPGARTDWDVRQPPMGIRLGGGAHTRLENIWFSRTHDAVNFIGCYSCSTKKVWFNSLYGVAYHMSGSASECVLNALTEPSVKGWQTTVITNGTTGCKINFNTGDPGPFGAFIQCTNDGALTITGCLRSSSGVPLIKANGTENLAVRDAFVDCAGSYLVDFGTVGSVNLSPRISNIKYFGSKLGANTGNLSSNYSFDRTNGDPYIANLKLDTLDSAFGTFTSSLVTGDGSTTGARVATGLGGGLDVYGMLGLRVANKALVNGSNVDVGAFWPHVRITGPTLPFQIHGIENDRAGQVNRFVITVSQVMTLKHLSGTETFASRQLKCPGGVDLVSDGSSLVVFEIWHNGTNWDVYPIYGFTPRAANQDLGFSASLASLTGETRTVTLSCAAVVGDVVKCSPRGPIPDGVILNPPWISAPGVASVRMFNTTGSAVDLSGVRLDFEGRKP